MTLWSHSAQRSALLERTRENPRLPGVPLPEALHLSAGLDSLGESGVVVMATPSFAVRETARMAAPLLREDAVVVSAAKGVERDTALCMTQVIEEELGGKGRVAALSGPSHAEEVGRRAPTGCVEWDHSVTSCPLSVSSSARAVPQPPLPSTVIFIPAASYACFLCRENLLSVPLSSRLILARCCHTINPPMIKASTTICQ